MMEHTAPMIVDIRNIRCGDCKTLVMDELATECKNCNAKFDRITSNHVGLADKLRAVRGEASVLETGDTSDDKYPELVGS